MTPPSASPGPSARLASLDQFRGYTVAAMIAVNFLGGSGAVHDLFKHHNTWCSYADTIMPQFFFAAGWALRLVWLRESGLHGAKAARGRTLRRGLSLLLFGVIFHQLTGDYRTWQELSAAGWHGFFATAFWRGPFEALTHIALATLWILPVLGCRASARFFFAAGSGLLHLALSAWFWYPLLQEKRVIDGGMLGFLTWALPMLAGAWVCDLIKAKSWQGAIRPLLAGGALLMAGGYAISCLNHGGGWNAPPFRPPWNPVDLWTMSQRASSLSYQTFASGFCLALTALFAWLCDGRGWRAGLFDTLGRNALAAYVLHALVIDMVSHFAPRDAPLAWALATGALCISLTWLMVRWLNRRGLFLRL